MCVLVCAPCAQLEEARAAAERSAQALVSAQEQLTSLQQAMDAKDKEMEALRLKQDRMQLTMQVRTDLACLATFR